MYLGMYVSVQSVRCSAQSSQNFFTQRFLRQFEDNYFILQNKYLCFYKGSSAVKIHRDDCTLSIQLEMLLRLATIIYILMAIYYP